MLRQSLISVAHTFLKLWKVFQRWKNGGISNLTLTTHPHADKKLEDQILWVLKSFLPTKTFTEEISLSNYKCIFSKPLMHLEFAKSRAMLAIRAKVVYVSTCQKRANFLLLRANVLKASQFFNLANQHAKRHTIFFNFACQKVCESFNCFSKEFFYIHYIFTHNIFYIFCAF